MCDAARADGLVHHVMHVKCRHGGHAVQHVAWLIASGSTAAAGQQHAMPLPVIAVLGQLLGMHASCSMGWHVRQ
jgi:hypothetical protein